jgi:hypothetical protein
LSTYQDGEDANNYAQRELDRQNVTDQDQSLKQKLDVWTLEDWELFE